MTNAFKNDIYNDYIKFSVQEMLVELFFENSQRIKPVNEVRKNVFSQVYDKIPSTPRFCTTENFCSVSSTSFTS